MVCQFVSGSGLITGWVTACHVVTIWRVSVTSRRHAAWHSRHRLSGVSDLATIVTWTTADNSGCKLISAGASYNAVNVTSLPVSVTRAWLRHELTPDYVETAWTISWNSSKIKSPLSLTKLIMSTILSSLQKLLVTPILLAMFLLSSEHCVVSPVKIAQSRPGPGQALCSKRSGFSRKKGQRPGHK